MFFFSYLIYSTSLFTIPTNVAYDNDGGGESSAEQATNETGFILSDAEKSDILRMHSTPHLYNKLG